MTGKWLTAEYIVKLLDSYIEFWENMEKKGNYEQEDNSNNEER